MILVRSRLKLGFVEVLHASACQDSRGREDRGVSCEVVDDEPHVHGPDPLSARAGVSTTNCTPSPTACSALQSPLPLGYLVPRSGTGSRFCPLRREECRRIKGAVPDRRPSSGVHSAGGPGLFRKQAEKGG